jgi:APA family basic amino acid/polyamine antiporter
MKNEKIIDGIFKGVVCPILALAGSAIILVGGIVSNPFYVICFVIFCALVCLVGYLYPITMKQANGN